MFPGFNTDIEAENCRYHIQTEVMGPREPAILTLVYKAGAIVNRVKRNYLEVLGEDPTEEEIRFLAERQHRRMIEEIGGVPVNGAGAAAPAAPGAPPATEAPEEESLDQLILNYLNAKGASDPGQKRPSAGR